MWTAENINALADIIEDKRRPPGYSGNAIARRLRSRAAELSVPVPETPGPAQPGREPSGRTGNGAIAGQRVPEDSPLPVPTAVTGELRACPFCGKPAEHDSRRYVGPRPSDPECSGHSVYCSECNAINADLIFGTKEEAFEHWNSRWPEWLLSRPQSNDELDQLHRYVERHEHIKFSLKTLLLSALEELRSTRARTPAAADGAGWDEADFKEEAERFCLIPSSVTTDHPKGVVHGGRYADYMAGVRAVLSRLRSGTGSGDQSTGGAKP